MCLPGPGKPVGEAARYISVPGRYTDLPARYTDVPGRTPSYLAGRRVSCVKSTCQVDFRGVSTCQVDKCVP